MGKGQRERETQNLKQAPGSELSAQNRMQGLNSRTLRSSAMLYGLSQPGALETIYIFFNVYLFLRQRETEHEWGRVRERETQNLKQAPGYELSAQSPTRGSNSRTARS